MSSEHKKNRGRPKTLDRNRIIDIAQEEYWKYGIHNVPLTKIAKLAEVSRPGIYKEFFSEDGLKAEVLKKYISISADPVHDNYNNYKKYPNHLLNHLDALVNDGNKFLTEDSNYNNIKRPKNSIGCLIQRSSINKYKLGPLSQDVINKYEKIRIRQFKKYILNAQKNNNFDKNIDPRTFAIYINTLFSSIQIMRLNTVPKKKIINMINIALTPFKMKNKQL